MSAKEQVMRWPSPIYPTGFEGLLHLDCLSGDPKDLMCPMNQIHFDDSALSSLGNISRETWVETSNRIGDENAFCSSDYVRICTILTT
jgi:hypothetical protein